MFEDLFIFEMANNHQGDVKHGINIIKDMAKLVNKYKIKAAVKLQFRHYDTFIHPNADPSKNSKVNRFLSTRLTDEEHKKLLDCIKEEGLLTMVTPFDEKSVDLAIKYNVDIIKVGSPSIYDFKLLEKISKTNKPIIVSSGGSDINHMDKLYSFFKHRFNTFAFMHCVSIYPTPTNKLYLSNISTFKNRYPDINIGYSTHEDPNNIDAIKIAVSLGATIYEKHVGKTTDKINLNKYSATYDQLDKWINSYLVTKISIGNNRIIEKDEKIDLNKLYRGVYINKNIKAGDLIKLDDIYYAFPIAENGILTGKFPDEGLIANKDYNTNDPILYNNLLLESINIYDYIHKIRGYLNECGIKIPYNSYMEISHHKGIENIYNTGCIIIDILKCEEYTKKYIIMLPNQHHPCHYHKLKDETFYILHGSLQIKLNNKYIKTLHESDILRLPRFTSHEFWTETGVIFEEISTKHYNDDSYYLDSAISNMKREDRKTKLYNWIKL